MNSKLDMRAMMAAKKAQRQKLKNSLEPKSEYDTILSSQTDETNSDKELISDKELNINEAENRSRESVTATKSEISKDEMTGPRDLTDGGIVKTSDLTQIPDDSINTLDSINSATSLDTPQEDSEELKSLNWAEKIERDYGCHYIDEYEEVEDRDKSTNPTSSLIVDKGLETSSTSHKVDITPENDLTAMVPEFQDIPTESYDDDDSINPHHDSEAGQLPVGFFDDEDQDATARGVEAPTQRRKRTIEKEYSRFTEVMNVEIQKKELIRHRVTQLEADDDSEMRLKEQKSMESRLHQLSVKRSQLNNSLKYVKPRSSTSIDPKPKSDVIQDINWRSKYID